MAPKKSASAPTALGTCTLAQLSAMFQSPLPLMIQVEVGGTPVPSRSTSSMNAESDGPLPPPFCQPKKTRACVAPVGATGLMLKGVQAPVGGLELKGIWNELTLPTCWFELS